MLFRSELLALDGKLFHYLGGLSMQRFQRPDVSDPLLLDTVAALTQRRYKLLGRNYSSDHFRYCHY